MQLGRQFELDCNKIRMKTHIVLLSYYVTKCHLSSDPSALNARLALRPFISAIQTRSWYVQLLNNIAEEQITTGS